MRKTITSALVGVCSVLALVGCSSDKEQSATEPMSSTAPMSTDTAMSSPMSGLDPETVEQTPTPTEPVVETSSEYSVDTSVGSLVPSARAKYGEFFTFNSGLSVGLSVLNPDYNPETDTEEGPDLTVVRPFTVAITIQNDTDQPIDLSTTPLKYRILQNGTTIVENSVQYSQAILQPGESESPIGAAGEFNMSAGPVEIIVAVDDGTSSDAVVFSE